MQTRFFKNIKMSNLHNRDTPFSPAIAMRPTAFVRFCNESPPIMYEKQLKIWNAFADETIVRNFVRFFYIMYCIE